MDAPMTTLHRPAAAMVLALVAAATVLPLPLTRAAPATAQNAPTVEQFVVNDARESQLAARVDGRWVVFEDDRRSGTPTPTATIPATNTPVPPPTATPEATTPPTAVPPAESTATLAPTTELATATPPPTVGPGTPGSGESRNSVGGSTLVASDLAFKVPATGMLRQVTDQADIRARNLDTNEDRRLTNGAYARQPDVSGNLATWAELGDDGRWSIVVYNLEDRTMLRRIDENGDQEYPSISRRYVVWQDSRRGNWDIRAYDLEEKRGFWVSNSSQDETRPSIDGTLVAFERDGLIWYHDLSTDGVERVEGAGGYDPSVSGDRIVFRSGGSRSEPRDAGIYVFDRRDGSVAQVNSTVNRRRGNPRISGDLVVWWDRRGETRDIYAYDLGSTSAIFD